jgi:hypothetical protein
MAGRGSLIGRIQQADLQQRSAKVGLVVAHDLLGQSLLRARRTFFPLHLMPLRQSRDLALAVGELAYPFLLERYKLLLYFNESSG